MKLEPGIQILRYICAPHDREHDPLQRAVEIAAAEVAWERRQAVKEADRCVQD